ncbi:hypothetical protein [Brevibacillus sp. SYSU BS000544]|uniref:hypothetical protein n=1 Tax=Brevibacillus sp. SYSU BS000544 TaxID=3416443 RepID=UPI003CE5C0A3
MIIQENSIQLDQRFERLREVIAAYRMRLTLMEQQVVELFSENQLSRISEYILEKKRIEERIQKLQSFVDHWEPLADMSID